MRFLGLVSIAVLGFGAAPSSGANRCQPLSKQDEVVLIAECKVLDKNLNPRHAHLEVLGGEFCLAHGTGWFGTNPYLKIAGVQTFQSVHGRILLDHIPFNLEIKGADGNDTVVRLESKKDTGGLKITRSVTFSRKTRRLTVTERTRRSDEPVTRTTFSARFSCELP